MTRRSVPSTASTCASSPVRSSPSSDPTAPARRRPSTWCSASPSRRAARPRSSARRPREAVIGGHVSAVLQTGGLLRDLTVRETVRMIASTYAAHSPGRRGHRPRRAEVAGRPPRLQVLRRRAAAAALRPGPPARPAPARPRRADGRHGRHGPARLLGHDARRRQRGSHRRLRHALPRGGRRLRRPDRPRRRRPHRRRWHDGRDPVAGERSHRLRDAAAGFGRRVRRRLRTVDGVHEVEERGTGSSSRPATPTRSRGCSCSTSAAPTSRSSPPVSSRPS